MHHKKRVKKAAHKLERPFKHIVLVNGCRVVGLYAEKEIGQRNKVIHRKHEQVKPVKKIFLFFEHHKLHKEEQRHKYAGALVKKKKISVERYHVFREDRKFISVLNKG